MILALAGTGLQLSRDDGWFLWMPAIRELKGRIPYYRDLLGEVPTSLTA